MNDKHNVPRSHNEAEHRNQEVCRSCSEEFLKLFQFHKWFQFLGRSEIWGSDHTMGSEDSLGIWETVCVPVDGCPFSLDTFTRCIKDINNRVHSLECRTCSISSCTLPLDTSTHYGILFIYLFIKKWAHLSISIHFVKIFSVIV